MYMYKYVYLWVDSNSINEKANYCRVSNIYLKENVFHLIFRK